MIETIYQVIGILLIALCLLYVLLIGIYTYGWFTLRLTEDVASDFVTPVSILIPVRNEQNNIGPCLQDLLAQQYPQDLYKVYVIDDHSEDNTREVVDGFVSGNTNISVIKLDVGKEGKKVAIRKGIESSEGALIVTTDADCRFNRHWLASIVTLYEKDRPRMIVGPVAFSENNSFFQQLQSLEFLSLIASGAGAVSVKTPILCNGANLAYEREAFEEVGGFDSSEKYVSGDDVFLLLRIKKAFGSHAIRFLKDRHAIVHTAPQKSFVSFLSQRIRWISKSRGYTNFEIIFTSLIVYLFNYLLFAGLVASIWIPRLLSLTGILFLVKIIMDLPIYWGISRFVKKPYLLWCLLPLQILYVFYVSIIGFAGNFIGFSWKGRKGY